jgi:3-methylfumaryl-CoA hydratase
MAELARPERPTFCDYSYRLVAPLFDGQGLIVSASAQEDAVRVTARDATSRTTATGVIRPAGSRICAC